MPTMKIPGHQIEEPADEMSAQETYMITPEHKRELVYQELMPKVLLLDERIHAQIGLWREHAKFLDAFADTFHLFHMPELHDNLVQTLFRYLMNGNNHLRQKVCKCLVLIMAH